MWKGINTDFTSPLRISITLKHCHLSNATLILLPPKLCTWSTIEGPTIQPNFDQKQVFTKTKYLLISNTTKTVFDYARLRHNLNFKLFLNSISVQFKSLFIVTSHINLRHIQKSHFWSLAHISILIQCDRKMNIASSEITKT